MKNKKSRLFLWISLAFFALTLIAFLICIIITYFQIKAYFPDDPDMVINEFGLAVFVYMLLMFPSLAVELSCIRSVYKTIKHNPRGIIKVCYLISAILSFSAFALQFLIYVGVIDLVLESGDARIEQAVLFWTEWPVFIVSFALGSLPVKRKDLSDTTKILNINI